MVVQLVSLEAQDSKEVVGLGMEDTVDSSFHFDNNLPNVRVLHRDLNQMARHVEMIERLYK